MLLDSILRGTLVKISFEDPELAKGEGSFL